MSSYPKHGRKADNAPLLDKISSAVALWRDGKTAAALATLHAAQCQARSSRTAGLYVTLEGGSSLRFAKIDQASHMTTPRAAGRRGATYNRGLRAAESQRSVFLTIPVDDLDDPTTLSAKERTFREERWRNYVGIAAGLMALRGGSVGCESQVQEHLEAARILAQHLEGAPSAGAKGDRKHHDVLRELTSKVAEAQSEKGEALTQVEQDKCALQMLHGVVAEAEGLARKAKIQRGAAEEQLIRETLILAKRVQLPVPALNPAPEDIEKQDRLCAAMRAVVVASKRCGPLEHVRQATVVLRYALRETEREHRQETRGPRDGSAPSRSQYFRLFAGCPKDQRQDRTAREGLHADWRERQQLAATRRLVAERLQDANPGLSSESAKRQARRKVKEVGQVRSVLDELAKRRVPDDTES